MAKRNRRHRAESYARRQRNSNQMEERYGPRTGRSEAISPDQGNQDGTMGSRGPGDWGYTPAEPYENGAGNL